MFNPGFQQPGYNPIYNDPPCPGGQIYIIKAGDTIYQLAQRYDLTVDEILEANPEIDPNALVIGQRICIPKTPSKRRGCLVLEKVNNENGEAVAHFNYENNSILVSAVNLPSPASLDSSRYVVFLKWKNQDRYSRFQLFRSDEGIWVGTEELNRPISNYERIVISAETGPGFSTPITENIVMSGDLKDICYW